MSTLPFLGFEFLPVKLTDCRILTDFLKRYPQPLTGYTFATLAAWNPFFHYRWTFSEPETLLVSCILEPDPHPHLLQPIGTLSPAVAQKLVRGAADLPYPLSLFLGCGRNLTDQLSHFCSA